MGLLDYMFGTRNSAPPSAQGLLGTGLAEQAAQVLQSRPYQMHVQEMKALGQQPMTPEQFLAQQRQSIAQNN
jgi:hypothetical protein